MLKKYRSLGVGITPTTTDLGQFLRARRIELGLKQVQVAELSGIYQTRYSEFETGKAKYLKPQQLEGLAKALQCDPSELKAGIPPKQQAEPKTGLGRLIRSRRGQLGLTLQDFAGKVGISRQYAQSLEINNRSIHYRLFEPLAKALELEPAYLSKFVDPTRKQTTNSLGQLVRSRRKELGLSITELAKKLRVSKQFVNQIELGRCPLSQNDVMIERLAEVLELDVAKLEAVRSRRRLKRKMADPTTLGGFLTARRLRLRLSQREVAECAETGPAVVCGVERGTYHPGRIILEKLSKALECQIPSELL